MLLCCFVPQGAGGWEREYYRKKSFDACEQDREGEEGEGEGEEGREKERGNAIIVDVIFAFLEQQPINEKV